MIEQQLRRHLAARIEAVDQAPPPVGDVVARGRRLRRVRRMQVLGAVAAFVALGLVVYGTVAGRGRLPVADGDSGRLEFVPRGFVAVGRRVGVIGDGQPVYEGVVGPVPRFDTAPLGTEVPWVSAPPPHWKGAARRPAIMLGEVGGVPVIIRVDADRPWDLDRLLGFRRGPIVNFGPGRISGGLDLTAEGEADVSFGRIDDAIVEMIVSWFMTPEDTAVVAVRVDGRAIVWQRPVSRFVIIPIPADIVDRVVASTPPWRFELAALAADGVVLETRRIIVDPAVRHR